MPAFTCTGTSANRFITSARPGAPRAIDGAQIVAAADGLAEHLAAVHEQDQRVAGLEDARVEVDADVLES